MSIKAKIEAIIYAAEEPVTFEQIFALVKEDARRELQRQRAESAELASASESSDVEVPEPDEANLSTAASIEPSQSAGYETTDAPAEVSSEASPDAETPLAEEQPEPANEPATATDAQSDPETQAQSEPEATEPAEPTRITDVEVKVALRSELDSLITDYNSPERGIEIRQIAGGYRMATKPEQHDAVRAFAKSLKPPIRLSLQALETLAVIAYKQPITAPEISEVRGVDSGGVLGTLLARKLINTSGRKQVIGRPMLYKTTKEFLLRFGLKDIGELPSMEEFEKLASESLGADLFNAQPAPEQTVEEAENEETESNNGSATSVESLNQDSQAADVADPEPAEQTEADEFPSAETELQSPDENAVAPNAGEQQAQPESADSDQAVAAELSSEGQ